MSDQLDTDSFIIISKDSSLSNQDNNTDQFGAGASVQVKYENTTMNPFFDENDSIRRSDETFNQRASIKF